jgi:hypothetical protein
MSVNKTNMELKLQELERLLSIQENYFDTLLELGLFFENSGQHQRAFEIYIEGLKKAEKAKNDFAGTMLGLLE